MVSSISILLRQFIELYERELDALYRALDSPDFAFVDVVSRKEQLSLIEAASYEAQSEIRRKTLIETSDIQVRHQRLRTEIDDSSEPLEADTTINIEELRKRLTSVEEAVKKSGLSREDFEASKVRKTLANKKLSAELLRIFADRIDEMTDAIERLDDIDFARLIPNNLRQPFQECHLNYVLGNFGTTCILCGAIMERALQDLLPSNKLLKELIVEAKDSGLLVGHNRRLADQVHDIRNAVVHGRIDFGRITSDTAWDTVIKVRTLMHDLYRGRLFEERN